ncbi:MAG: LytTR family transcriptional regulator DNA-binding domain-containing protein, partial [Lachnospiraceae bacterium]|nr:LytTR family transcriptional regulator DNA-binding domain-containing protein [Lachnospiraceae bacterium]
VKNLTKAEQVLLFQIEGESVRISASEILVVEAFAHSVSLQTTNGSYKVNMSISEIAKTLDEGFVRCHRSYVVNLKHVGRITRTAVVLDNGTEVPLSRNSYQSVNQAFISYYRSEEG